MKRTRVTTTSGKRMMLYSDDTLTLAFPGMIESTPASLRARVSEHSLREIELFGDANESGKAAKALALGFKRGVHG